MGKKTKWKNDDLGWSAMAGYKLIGHTVIWLLWILLLAVEEASTAVLFLTIV